jgi:hypothetical protein
VAHDLQSPAAVGRTIRVVVWVSEEALVEVDATHGYSSIRSWAGAAVVRGGPLRGPRPATSARDPRSRERKKTPIGFGTAP